LDSVVFLQLLLPMVLNPLHPVHSPNNPPLVMDCYYPLAPDLFLLIIGLKNVFGFGFSYAIIPWITAWGYGGAFGTTSGIFFFAVLLGWPLMHWGKRIRHTTAKWKIILTS
jgi:hypothetical protein